MTDRFTGETLPNEKVISRRDTRALAQRRAYERWNEELALRYRRRPDAEDGYQDLTNLEHLATEEDVMRLNELLREEYESVGQDA